MEIRVAINGFGRIGRQLARIILSLSDTNIRLVAVNTIEDINHCAFLLKYDSSHGIFPRNIAVNEDHLQVDEYPPIIFLAERNPKNLPWKTLGVDIVIESTGRFAFNGKSHGHLHSGASKVIITAAASKADVTLCYGVNNSDYDSNTHHIISSSSCTTNCIAPVAKIMEERLGIEAGMATFLHSYTGGQPLLDSGAKNLRCSRSAALNIIPTETSAAKQLPLVLPSLRDKFTAIAVRVPTPLVHLADFTLKIRREMTKTALLDILLEEEQGSFAGIISLLDAPLVSCDLKNSHFSSVIDVQALHVNKKLVKMFVWHDNEFSYSNRVIDLLLYISKTI